MGMLSSFNTRTRACKGCSYLAENKNFMRHGCPNCKSFETNSRTISDSFKGVIASINPKKSWVAKWQRIDQYKEGCYSLTVDGYLPDDCQHAMEDKGIVYIDRSKTMKDLEK